MHEYKNVLVIDDDLLTTELIKEILETDGYNCEICQKVKSLKKCLKQREFEIFFIDLMLDGLEGIKLIRELRIRYPESVIMVITGLSAGEHMQSAIEAGADFYFNKPVNATNLLDKLRSIIQRILEPHAMESADNLIWESFQEASNPIFVINKSGDLYFANNEFLKLSGLKNERITRFNLENLRLRNIDDPGSLVRSCSTSMKETRIMEIHFNQGKIDESWYNVVINPMHRSNSAHEPLFLFQLFNITRKKQMDNFILNNEEKFRSFISLSNDGMALVNEKGQVIEWNGSLSRITGISMEKVYGEAIWDIMSWGNIRIDDKAVGHEVLKKFVLYTLKKGLNLDNAKENLCQITHADGHIVHLQYSLFTIRVDNGYRLGMVIRDNTASVNDRIYIASQHEKLNQAYQEMEKLARIDPLTQISNRRDVEIRLDYEMTRYERHHNPFSLSIMDIDDFKKFNDTYGHDMGDYVLTEIANLMKETIRAQDILGRWGGEEFILVYPETTSRGGEIIAERIRLCIDHHQFSFKGEDVSVSITGGLAEYHPGEERELTVKRADKALYRGKNSGKNCIVISN
jgi:diguanylate cyclase (GGDEF)-like protein/PAS domain S-box-containing protein